jgi:integrase
VYVYQLPSGRWRCQISAKGVRDSDTFATKTAAKAWGTRREAEILDGTASRWPAKTLGDAMARYEREITPSKGSARFERVAFDLMRKQHADLCARVLHSITPADLGAWRDARLQMVSGSTVVRYAALLRNVWTVASTEWGWCPQPTPWKAVRLPAENPPRTRINGWREIRVMLRRLNYRTGRRPGSMQEEVAYAWLIALRTAMRAAEVLRIEPRTTDLAQRVLKLEKHKTSKATGRPRFVPITKQAARLVSLCLRFTVSSASLDALFRKARSQCGLSGFTFHDSRATAVTLLARKVDVLTLARITGHRNIDQLQTYYREADAAIALRM